MTKFYLDLSFYDNLVLLLNRELRCKEIILPE